MPRTWVMLRAGVKRLPTRLGESSEALELFSPHKLLSKRNETGLSTVPCAFSPFCFEASFFSLFLFSFFVSTV